MNDKDKLLLTLLRKDARSPIVALARDLGLSRTATQERLAKLVAQGAIAKFTIEEGGYAHALQTAHLLVRLDKGYRCAQVVPKLKGFPFISLIHSIAGDSDMLLRCDASTLADIETTRAKLVTIPGIAFVTTMVVLERHLG